ACCWPTSPPATSTRRWRAACWSCWRTSTRRARRSSWSPTTRSSPHARSATCTSSTAWRPTCRSSRRCRAWRTLRGPARPSIPTPELDVFGYYAKLALRSLRRNWVLSALMVLAIALGIGTSMTTLTVMHLLSGDPLPDRSDTLFYVQVDASPSRPGKREPLDMIDYRSAMDLWSSRRADRQAMVAQSPVKLQAPDSRVPPLMTTMLSTTSDFFAMFDVPFRYGGPWRAADGEQRARVAVISADLNRKLFGGADSVGRSLLLRGTTVRIVGVLDDWRPSPQF